jgi:hypothetical protein
MNTISPPHVPFAELPSQARALLSIYANAALAGYMAKPPKQSELIPILEVVWDQNRLHPRDLSDPFRMTALLKKELESFSLAGDVQ